MKPALTLLKNLSTLHLALAISLAVHAVLLTVRFVDPESFNRVFQDTPLEVILVNAKTNERSDPTQLQAIAQASLAGGGEAATGRASSPLPPSMQARFGDTTEDEEQRMEALMRQQNQILAQVRQQLAIMPPTDVMSLESRQERIEREKKRQALLKTLGEIERRINEQNARPKKRHVSPATREAVYAIYYDTLRRKIEERGTSNFPQYKGKKLYGELTMSITVDHTGKVLNTMVDESSGNATLDRRAQAIVRGLEFGPFGDALRRQYDQLVIVSRFNFSRDDALRTQVFSSTDTP